MLHVTWEARNTCTIEDGAILGHEAIDVRDGDRLRQRGTVHIGAWAHISAGATVARGRNDGDQTTIGRGAIIGPQALVGHGCHIGEDAIIHGGARLAGYVIIGAHARVGMGACVRNRVVIGEGAVVGIGAVVTRNVPAAELWVGNPARKLRDV